MIECLAALYPRPRSLTARDGVLTLAGTLALEMPPDWRGQVAPELSAIAGALAARPMGATRVIVRTGTVDAAREEAYRLLITPEAVEITAAGVAGARYGLRTLGKMLGGDTLPCCEIVDAPTLRYRGVQFDIGRVIERPGTIERLLPHYAALNYNVIQLYFENAFQFPSHPKLARPWAWTLEQAMGVAETAARYGMTVIPAIQALGHCHWVCSHPDYAAVLCPSHPRTLAMLNDMIHDVAPLATSGIIHLGMDESPYIGRCPRCAPRREAIGEGGIYVAHANAVAAMTREAGKRPGIWGDMFYYFPEAVAQLDKAMLIFDWYYYTFEQYPRVELFEHAEMDTSRLYREHGIDSWGCPSSFYTAILPTYSPDEVITNCRDWARYMGESGGDGVMITQWELSISTIDLCLPGEAAMAGFLWGDGMATSSSDLLRDACAFLYDRPGFAPLLEELGTLRFHGHGTRRWLNAQTLAHMITYGTSADDLAKVQRVDLIAAQITDLVVGSRAPEMLAAFVPAAKWLAYQYRKRACINQAALLACAGKCADAADVLTKLQEEAFALAGAWKQEWDRNRYVCDTAAVPARLRKEAELFDAEIVALRAEGYAGALVQPVLIADVIDTFGAIARLDVQGSRDGETFNDLGAAWVLQFDSKAAGKYEAQEISYSFPIPSVEDAAYVRVKALGPGRYTLKGLAIRQGERTWGITALTDVHGEVAGAEGLLAGGTAVLGHHDPKALFYEKLEEGDSSQAYSVLNGWVTVTMG
jgi:hypothetical protein